MTYYLSSILCISYRQNYNYYTLQGTAIVKLMGMRPKRRLLRGRNDRKQSLALSGLFEKAMENTNQNNTSEYFAVWFRCCIFNNVCGQNDEKKAKT